MLLEEKINLQIQLLHAANIWNGNESSDNEKIEKADKEIADYTRLVHNEGTETTQLRQEVVLSYCIYFLKLNYYYKGYLKISIYILLKSKTFSKSYNKSTIYRKNDISLLLI